MGSGSGKQKRVNLTKKKTSNSLADYGIDYASSKVADGGRLTDKKLVSLSDGDSMNSMSYMTWAYDNGLKNKTFGEYYMEKKISKNDTTQEELEYVLTEVLRDVFQKGAFYKKGSVDYKKVKNLNPEDYEVKYVTDKYRYYNFNDLQQEYVILLKKGKPIAVARNEHSSLANRLSVAGRMGVYPDIVAKHVFELIKEAFVK